MIQMHVVHCFLGKSMDSKMRAVDCKVLYK